MPAPGQKRRPLVFGPNRTGFRPAAKRPSLQRPQQSRGLLSNRQAQRSPPLNKQPLRLASNPTVRLQARPNQGGLFDFLNPFKPSRWTRHSKHESRVGHALKSAGKQLLGRKQQVPDRGDERMRLLAMDPRAPMSKTNPWFGTELEWRVSDFVRGSWAEIKRSTKFAKDPQERFENEFKMAVVGAIGQGQVQSREQMHEFMRELAKEYGINVEPKLGAFLDPQIVEKQLFTDKQSKDLNKIFSDYEKIARHRKYA